jgi:IclR family transcriptional regulator, acetate operon repressor
MSVKSALRTLQILETFAAVKRPMTLGEIAGSLAAPKSSCLALLVTLAQHGYMYRSGPGPSWYPSRRWLDGAQVVADHDPIATWVRRALERLRDATGETAIHAVLVDDRSVYLDVVESRELVRYTARVGDTKPLHVSASGRAQLALLDEERLRALVAQLPLDRHSPRSLTSRRALWKEIAETRTRGWSANLGEFRADVASVGAGFGVQDSAHALVIAAPLHRTESRVAAWGRLLRKEADALAGRLIAPAASAIPAPMPVIDDVPRRKPKVARVRA